MRRFYAPKENFSDGRIYIAADETRHLRDVLRLQTGDKIAVFDGEGNEFLAKIETIKKSGVELKIIQTLAPSSAESPLHLTLAAAMLKGEKFDLVVQKAVEIGVTRLVPLHTARCDVNIKGADKRVDRWRKIVIDAAKQSGRARLMSIDVPVEFAEFVHSETSDEIIVFTERGGESFLKLNEVNKITAVIGPEGGWDDSEIELVKTSGVKLITLGGRILRAETAAISIAAILQHRFGDLH